MEESDFVIHFSALEKELESAVEADKKYRRENDAKFRALHQKVGTYEEFRDIVLASHLKPLDRKDRTDAPRKQPWNTVASTKRCQDQQTSEGMQPQLLDFQPRTASEFSRDWRRLGNGEGKKYGLLVSLGGEALGGIFSAEVGFGLLGELLLALSQDFQPADWQEVVGVLDGLSRTPRFSLNVSLLSRVEKTTCEELFLKIQKAADCKVQTEVPLSDLKPSCDTTTVSDDSNAAEGCDGGRCGDEKEEAAGNNSHLEKLKDLMHIYGVPSSGNH